MSLSDFEDVIRDASGGNVKVPKGNYLPSGQHPIIDQGQDFVGGYTDNSSSLVKGEGPWIVFGDHTRALKFVDFPFCMGADGVKVLQLRDPAKVDLKYVYHFLQFANIPSAGYSRHYKFLKRLKILLPPLDEQKRIAAILDKADQLRQKRRQAIALLDSLTQSIFLEMFGDPISNPRGWETQELAGFEEFLTSGSRGWATYYADEGRPFIRIQNLKNGKLSTEDLVFVNAPHNAEAQRTTVSAGDVLISITADLGRIAVVPSSLDGGANINQHIALFRPRGINSTYLASYLASEGGRRQFHALNRQGVKAGLNFSDIRRLRIVAPPIEMQKKFEQNVIFHSAQQDHQRIGSFKSDSLFSSLQHRAFTGQL